MNNLLVAASALQYLNPYERTDWYKAAMMLKSEFGDAAFYVWDDWSQQCPAYNARDARAVWKSCKATGGVTIGSLYYCAKQNGWQGSTGYIKPSPTEIAARKLARQTEQQKADAKRRLQHAEVAEKAIHLWHSSLSANPSHDYLLRKRIQPLRLRQRGNALVAPMFSDGVIVNLQFIQPDGSKRFMKGGQVAGAYVPIGQLSNVIYICEGFATGATIHQATNLFVLCALSAGNLLRVAQQARMNHPAAHIVICGDNDHNTPNNPGVAAAHEAAMAVGAEVMIPEFPVGHPGTDWNDYYLMEQEAVQ